MSDRQREIDAFLSQAGWDEAQRDPIKGDASTRRYTRLNRDGEKAILMDAPKGEETPAEPNGASVEDRKALGYNALARLAGPNLEAFLTTSNQLTQRGFSAPKIINADVNQGFALLEDFGGGDYWKVLDEDLGKERTLYEAAVDTLAAIYRSTFPRQAVYQGSAWTIRDYDTAALLAETEVFLDYYAPDVGRKLSDDNKAQFYELWQDAFGTLTAHAHGLCLRDFHAQNLFWLPERSGQARVGLIDFQDALFAHPSYDLVSLLEDARRDVDPILAEPMKARFCDKAGLRYNETFEAAYAVMAAQRNTKIMGIFVRLAVRDGKPSYRELIPRVQAHLKRDLSHPACMPLRDWMEAQVPEVLS